MRWLLLVMAALVFAFLALIMAGISFHQDATGGSGIPLALSLYFALFGLVFAYAAGGEE